jgi:hypothetical protein
LELDKSVSPDRALVLLGNIYVIAASFTGLCGFSRSTLRLYEFDLFVLMTLAVRSMSAQIQAPQAGNVDWVAALPI